MDQRPLFKLNIDLLQKMWFEMLFAVYRKIQPFSNSKIQISKTHVFTDRDHKSLDILNLTSETGSGWSAGVKTYSERYLESNRSKVTSYDR